MSFGLPNVTGPRDLPPLREWLIHNFRDGGPFDWMADARIIRRKMELASLWWVTTEMCDLLAESAPTYPNDAVLNIADVKTVSGFAVFEDDFAGIDADPIFEGRQVRTSAVLWGPSKLPPIDGVIRPGISFSWFTRVALHDGLEEDDLRRCAAHLAALSHYNDEHVEGLSGTLFAYMGRTDWLDGWRVNEVIKDNPHGDSPWTLDSMAEDRRLMAALWLLTQTPRLVVTREAKIDRPTRRRSERKGYSSDVRVVTLAGQPEYEPGDTSAPSVGERREWKHQWVVGPHYAWQPHGPGSSLRKLIVRGPFMKGDPTKPLLGGERVWKVIPPK